MTRRTVEGVEVELDEGVSPDELERYGADSRSEVDIDLAALEAEAIADAWREEPEDDEGEDL